MRAWGRDVDGTKTWIERITGGGGVGFMEETNFIQLFLNTLMNGVVIGSGEKVGARPDVKRGGTIALPN